MTGISDRDISGIYCPGIRAAEIGMDSADNKKQGVTLKRWQLAVIILLTLALVGGGIFVGLNWDNWFGGQEKVRTALNPDIDPDAGAWAGETPENKSGEAAGIQIPGYPSVTLPADTQDVKVALLNPEGNPCYFRFELVLKDTEETLYTSKLVPPGQAVTEISLSRALPAGEYNAVIKISTTSLEDGETAMNGANVETVLIVQ